MAVAPVWRKCKRRAASATFVFSTRNSGRITLLTGRAARDYAMAVMVVLQEEAKALRLVATSAT